MIVFGNQKSGTSVIASLLADLGGLSKTIDIPPLWRDEGAEIVHGRARFGDVVRRHPSYFATELIKEPMMTFFVGQVLDEFPRARCAFVVRDPRDNIRSLLDSRKLPGNLPELTDELRAALGGRVTVDSRVWGGEGENYIGVLAHRWNLAAGGYVEHRERLRLAKYEEFMQAKLAFLGALASDLDIAARHDVSDKLEHDYQPRGNRGAKWGEFFGADNLARIERICGERMAVFGYRTSAAP